MGNEPFVTFAFFDESVSTELNMVPVVDGLSGGILDAKGYKGKSTPVESAIFRAFIANVYHSQSRRADVHR